MSERLEVSSAIPSLIEIVDQYCYAFPASQYRSKKCPELADYLQVQCLIEQVTARRYAFGIREARL